MSVPGESIRDAVPDDAVAMGRLHVRAWQHAYRGVMPDEYLDSLDPDERIEMWRERLARTDLPAMLVVEALGEVAGFAVFGPERSDTGVTGIGELYAINLDPAFWGHGLGRALLGAATQRLAATGYPEAVLWVVPENARARGLYESEGWSTDGASTTDELLGVAVSEVRYRRQLSVLR